MLDDGQQRVQTHGSSAMPGGRKSDGIDIASDPHYTKKECRRTDTQIDHSSTGELVSLIDKSWAQHLDYVRDRGSRILWGFLERT